MKEVNQQVVRFSTGYKGNDNVPCILQYQYTQMQPRYSRHRFFSVRVGSSSRKRAGLVFDVAEKILHEDFGEGSGSFPNDIAILKFSESIIGPGAAYVALLPEDDNDFAHERCDISGWGFSQFGLGLPEVLQAAKMTVLSEECCAASYEDIGYDSINAGHVCVVSPNSDSCIGDSGGPLTCGNTLVGLTSFGVIGCLPGFPAAYTRITHFRQWIKDNSGI
ncbi:fibrinolytic enzyme, isozyme C-like [Argopecten irradians]|uniref:fibrinolytic enzyme, isozyme C-like n=1 Tax=Argopecten irradians TaxID=31199 RepID=UPI00371F244B